MASHGCPVTFTGTLLELVEFAQHSYTGLPSQAAPDALASAQRRMLTDARYATPYFWASYQVSGRGSSR